MEERRNSEKKLQEEYLRSLERIKKDNKYVPENKETILNFLHDGELGKTILKGQKKKIGYRRLMKYVTVLKQMDHIWFKKSFRDMSEEEMDNFILGLERGYITKSTGEPYSEETKATIKKLIRKFYKWLLGDNEEYPNIVKYIDTSYKIAEIHPITKDEVDLLIEHANKVSHKLIIAFLFDSGARADEFLNVKRSDLQKENGCYKVRIRVSKTKPRTINLPLYTDLIDRYLKHHMDKDKEYICSLNYDSMRIMISRLGEKVLNKRIYPHLFRHSSATFYANRLSHFQMCYRYGWGISSSMPSRYIDFNGIADQEATLAVKNEISESVKHDNEKLKEEVSLLSASLRELQQKESERMEIERKRQLEMQLHQELMARSGEFENKEGISDIKEVLFQVLKEDDKLIQSLRLLINE